MFDIKLAEKDFQNVVKHCREVFASIRVGMLQPDAISHTEVMVYGSNMKLNEVATISVAANTLVVAPYDKSTFKNILASLEENNSLKLNIKSDGEVIRISSPAITEERRKEYVKYVKNAAEESKVTIRRIRKDQLDEIRKEKASISEDEIKNQENALQKLVDKFSDEISAILDKKIDEIMK
jgi:ribosome recycling factor